MKFRSLVARMAMAGGVVGALGLSGDGRAEQTKMAVVDVQRALTLTEDGMRASATLKKIFEPRKNEYERQQAELQKVKEDLDRQAVQLGKAVYTQKMQDLQQKAVELQAAMVEANKQFEKKQRELTDPIFEKIMAIVKHIATTDGYDLIVDRASLTYTRNDIDLTDKCIQQYNSGTPTPPAAATPTTAPTPSPAPVPAPAPPKR